MRERPILFSAAMVLAILAGRKFQTRRILKHPHAADIDAWAHVEGVRWEFGVRGDGGSVARMGEMRCPYGAPGDHLWVRETWGLHIHGDFTCWCVDSIKGRSPDDLALSYQLAYAADATSPYDHWRPSIHMPRWASRITLEVTGVRVERLQAISEADAIAEGIGSASFYPDDGFPLSIGYSATASDGKSTLYPTARRAYEALWESINGAGSWATNPWLWVVSFRRLP